MTRPDGANIWFFNGFLIFWYRVTAKLYRLEWFGIFVSDGSSRKAISQQNKNIPLGAPRVPSHRIPWAPKGSPRMGGSGPPPMGSLWLPRVPSPMGALPWEPFGLPRVPSHGIPPHLPLIFCPARQKINNKRINQRLFSEVSYLRWYNLISVG